MKIISTTGLLLVLSLGVSAQGIDGYFPESGRIQGEVMVIGATPELESLAQRMQAAVAANAEWFRSYVEKAEDKVLPYHDNFGITEEEYELFLNLSESGMALQRVASVELTLDKSEDGSITFVTESKDFPLHSVSISGNEKFVETPYGRLNRSADINQIDSNTPTGRWSGPQWEHEEISENLAWRVQLAIGKRKDFGDGIIYYNVIYQSNSAPERHQFIILYPLP